MDTIRPRSALTHDWPCAPNGATTRGQIGRGRGTALETNVCARLMACRQDFLRFFRRHLRRREDVEDAMQNFCLKVIRGARTLRDGDRIDAWLGRVLRNTLIDHYRQRALWRRAADAYNCEMQGMVCGIAPPDHEEAPCSCLHDALPTLRSDYAEILRRVDLEEQPREQAAAELGLTANNAAVRLHRARRALRRKLEEICPACRDGRAARCDRTPTAAARARLAETTAACCAGTSDTMVRTSSAPPRMAAP